MKDTKTFFEIKVDSKAALPVYEQIKRGVKSYILSGHLQENDQMPSIRELSLKLKINPNTIIKTYFQLEVEGFIVSRPGSGYYVHVDPQKISKESREMLIKETDEYISRVNALGYSIEDAVEELSRRKVTFPDSKNKAQGRKHD